MNSLKLKISIKDWLYIILVAAFFGFLISLVFYFLNEDLKSINTIIFSICSAISVALFSFLLISFSNHFILPKVNEKFWYLISFGFSFLSGFFGFCFNFLLFSTSSYEIVSLIANYWIHLGLIIGLLTFLIGLLLHQFISMKYKNEYVNNEVLEAKIKALENELNPHFLFNALNSISELIYVDQKRAEKATLSLSTFLRNAISEDGLISLEDEINMVKTYLEIENIRFEDNIKLKLQISEEFKSILVPKFSIQLLVENAIKHGYTQESLNILIKTYDKKIEVKNDGKKIENIKFGTGLNNLQKRLNFLNVGTLSYESKNEETIFTINLRVKK